MANAFKGEVAFNSGDRTLKLSFSANALADLEDRIGKGVVEFGQIMQDPNKVRMKDVRAMIIVGLQDQQPEMSEADAIAVFRTMGPADAMEVVVKAFMRAFPQEAEASPAQGEGAPNPQKPGQDGTGSAS